MDMLNFLAEYNIDTEVLFIPNKYRMVVSVHKEIISLLTEHYDDNILSPIPLSNDLNMVPNEKKPLLNQTKGGKAMQKMIKEVLSWAS